MSHQFVQLFETPSIEEGYYEVFLYPGSKEVSPYYQHLLDFVIRKIYEEFSTMPDTDMHSGAHIWQFGRFPNNKDFGEEPVVYPNPMISAKQVCNFIERLKERHKLDDWTVYQRFTYAKDLRLDQDLRPQSGGYDHGIDPSIAMPSGINEII